MAEQITIEGQLPVPLVKTHYLIGRGEECDLLMPEADSSVSRRHALLDHDETGAWTLTDLKSRNGTHVNDQILSGKHRLSDGDVIRIGGTRVFVTLPAHRPLASEVRAEEPLDAPREKRTVMAVADTVSVPPPPTVPPTPMDRPPASFADDRIAPPAGNRFESAGAPRSSPDPPREREPRYPPSAPNSQDGSLAAPRHGASLDSPEAASQYATTGPAFAAPPGFCPECRSPVIPGNQWCSICRTNVLRPEIGKLADPFKRLFAYGFEWLLPIGLFLFSGLGSLMSLAGMGAGTGGQVAGSFVGLLVLIGLLAYVVWCLKLFGHGMTPGKKLLGLMVVRSDGRPAEFFTMLIREWVGKWISGVFGLGFLWILIDKDNQGWHDKLVGTYVVERRTGQLV